MSKKINAWIPDDLHRKFKKKVIDNETSITEALTDMIEDYVKR